MRLRKKLVIATIIVLVISVYFYVMIVCLLHEQESEEVTASQRQEAKALKKELKDLREASEMGNTSLLPADKISDPPLPFPDGPPLAVVPFTAEQAKQHQQAWAEYLAVPVETTNSLGMTLVLIPPGEYIMGSPGSEVGRYADEGPQHRVRITRPFYLGKYETTQEEFERVMDINPSRFCAAGDGKDKVEGLDTSRHPVERATWSGGTDFCRRLSALSAEKEAGRSFRLPTEAEWEYACRAGTTTPFYFGETLLPSQATFKWSASEGVEAEQPDLERTTTVGSYPPNAFGLHDMHGNVWEFCSDRHSWETYYANSPLDDPTGPTSGNLYVARGGA